MEHLPLLTVSSQQARAIIADRAERLLRPAATHQVRENDDEISCTPAFGSSSLAKKACYQEAGVRKAEDELLLLLGTEGDSDVAALEEEGDAAAQRVGGNESEEDAEEKRPNSVLNKGDVINGSVFHGAQTTASPSTQTTAISASPLTTALPADVEQNLTDNSALCQGQEGAPRGGDSTQTESLERDRDAPRGGNSAELLKSGHSSPRHASSTGAATESHSAPCGSSAGRDALTVTESPKSGRDALAGSLKSGCDALAGSLKSGRDALAGSPKSGRDAITSFVEELQGVSYRTVWELGACELTGTVADFYVPSLFSVLGPSKVCVIMPWQRQL